MPRKKSEVMEEKKEKNLGGRPTKYDKIDQKQFENSSHHCTYQSCILQHINFNSTFF